MNSVGRTLALAVLLTPPFTLAATRASAALPLLLTVNSPGDAIDANPGDFTCETQTGNKTCTLRAAVMEANRNSGSTIILPAGTWNLTIPPSGLDDETTGDLNLDADVTISGAGASVTIIEAVTLGDRVFRIAAG
ncbi:MAG TPA: hypothetical protein VKF32_05475, partial [Thermoanaerobaculia bacterium]|nr:hypothetical protein [Thermoanaerobaculia bacterium]